MFRLFDVRWGLVLLGVVGVVILMFMFLFNVSIGL